MKKRLYFLAFFILLIVGLYTELAYQTTHINHRGIHDSPVVWLIGALVFCIGAAYFGRNHTDGHEFNHHKYNYLVLITGCILIILGLYESSVNISRIFIKYPVDAAGSDIVPSIQFYVRRLLAGEKVYAPMLFNGYTLQPTYLTFMWLPFLPAELIRVDYRWMPIFYFSLALILWAVYSFYKRSGSVEWLMKVSICTMMIILISKHVPTNFMHSVEFLPVAFYLVLCITLLNRKSWIVALGILVCLLSRYTFTFWLPVYLLIIWGEYGFKFVLRVGLIVLVGVLVFYFIPFIGRDIDAFLDGLKYYNENALSKWDTFSWQPEGAKPFHLSRGLGLAIHYYDFAEGELVDRQNFLRLTQLIISVVSAILIYVGYLLIKKKKYDIKLYLMISLKFYIVLFYSFIHVPYSYLFLLPCLLIIPILFYARLSFPTIVVEEK